MIEEILRFLTNKPNGSTSSSEIMKEVDIDEENLNIIIEYLFEEEYILKPHQQSRSASEPKYDLIVISDKGKEFVSQLAEPPINRV